MVLSRNMAADRESQAVAVADMSSADVATAIKTLRGKSRLTQAELAEQAGVSASFISQLERAHTDVTISTLNRICAALDTTIGQLLSAPTKATSRILRKDNYKRLDYNGVDKFVLTREEMHDVDVCLLSFPPGSSTGLRGVRHPNRTELWICKSEYLGIELGSELHILRESDTLDFPSHRQNIVYNPGPTPSEAILIIKNHEEKK